jgi:hypothetical protein
VRNVWLPWYVQAGYDTFEDATIQLPRFIYEIYNANRLHNEFEENLARHAA